jgi:HEAT repeat protein
MIESLSDDDWLVRTSAAISLGKIADKKAISAIEAKLKSIMTRSCLGIISPFS